MELLGFEQNIHILQPGPLQLNNFAERSSHTKSMCTAVDVALQGLALATLEMTV